MTALAVLVVALGPGTAGGESRCFGSTSAGALRDGCKLPSSGDGFSAYSRLGPLLGRTSVHCSVRDVMLASYASLHEERPDSIFLYGETGLSNGGRFAPHKTHQNGLSVDFMVPVKDPSGQSVPLPTWPTNKFGYGIDFDSDGRYGNLTIDFEAMASHIHSVSDAAAAAGVGIWRVIFDPRLQPLLRQTQAWPRIKHLQFSKRESWVRHDEHYHIDFELPCDSLAELGR